MNKFLNFLESMKEANPLLVESVIKSYTLIEASKTKKVYPEHYEHTKKDSVLQKYSGDEYSIRFSQSWEMNGKDFNKVGYNYNKSWGNPRGVYAYPLDDFKQNITSSYATNYDTAFILKRVNVGNQIDDIGNLARNEYVPYVEKLEQYIINSSDYPKINNHSEFINFLKDSEWRATNKSDGGLLFYLIVRLSEMSNKSNKDIEQTKLWINVLGVTYIGDDGKGIIHPSEPKQNLFLSPKSYIVVDSFDNTINSKSTPKHILKENNYSFLSNMSIKEQQEYIDNNYETIIKELLTCYHNLYKYISRDLLNNIVNDNIDLFSKYINTKLLSKLKRSVATKLVETNEEGFLNIVLKDLEAMDCLDESAIKQFIVKYQSELSKLNNLEYITYWFNDNLNTKLLLEMPELFNKLIYLYPCKYINLITNPTNDIKIDGNILSPIDYFNKFKNQIANTFDVNILFLFEYKYRLKICKELFDINNYFFSSNSTLHQVILGLDKYGTEMILYILSLNNDDKTYFYLFKYFSNILIDACNNDNIKELITNKIQQLYDTNNIEFMDKMDRRGEFDLLLKGLHTLNIPNYELLIELNKNNI